MKNELFIKPTSHIFHALAFFEPVSHVSKEAVESCLEFVCLGQSTAGFKMLMPACTFCTKTCPVHAQPCPSGSETGQSQSGAIWMSSVSYLPLPACLVLDLCYCLHDGAQLSGSFHCGAQREEKGSIHLEKFLF